MTPRAESNDDPSPRATSPGNRLRTPRTRRDHPVHPSDGAVSRSDTLLADEPFRDDSESPREVLMRSPGPSPSRSPRARRLALGERGLRDGVQPTPRQLTDSRSSAPPRRPDRRSAPLNQPGATPGRRSPPTAHHPVMAGGKGLPSQHIGMCADLDFPAGNRYRVLPDWPPTGVQVKSASTVWVGS